VTGERFEIDHLVLGVADLDAAAEALLDRHGLVALPGGRHPAWGTANRIVPLGSAYLELVAVVEPDVAAASGFGAWVADMAAGRCGWGWAVRTDDIEAAAARLGLGVVAGSRVTPDGTELRWRLAGVEAAASERALPFFIAWDEGTPPPGTTKAHHPAGDVRLVGLTVEADVHRLEQWLGATDLPVDVVPGRRGLVGVEIASSAGTIRLVPGW
jgi:hypothetical protein